MNFHCGRSVLSLERGEGEPVCYAVSPVVKESAIPESAVVRVTDRQVACDVADETVILHLHEGVYYGLNRVGTCIWRNLQTPCRVEQLVDAVLAEFEVSRERCLEDVRALLGDLERHQLVTVSGESAQ